MSENTIETRIMPLLALRGLCIFPGMLMTFDVERSASIAALGMAAKADQLIFLAMQKSVGDDAPEEKDIYCVGTVCRLRQQLRQPRGGVCRVMVEGLFRAKSVHMETDAKISTAEIFALPDKEDKTAAARREALVRSCLSLYESYLQMNPEGVSEQLISLLANPQPAFISNYIAQNVPFRIEDKQSVLEELNPSRRLSLVMRLLRHESDVLSIERDLSESTQEAMTRSQREYYLREELKIIQSELGEEGQIDDIDEYRAKIDELKAPDEVRQKLRKELSRLSKQPFGSAEASVLRGYLDVCLDIPWGTATVETVDIAKARRILEDEHFGLEKVKERIIEYLAVKKLSGEIKGGLICLVGPPGTGKTSIAMSVARAVNRKLVRISLGGVHDEAEIRGHRKTYIGAMPGRIINGLIQSGSSNPLMVLDEIDKLASDYRGDPSAALLEALDPEQNSTFRDNFLELPFDLSGVFFITTANTTDTIPRALLDRMEVIELSSYTDEEKLQIAKRYLLPKQRKKHGISGNQLRVSDAAFRAMIAQYTRESGVRQLEREIARLCRKTAGGIAEGQLRSLTLRPEDAERWLGPAKFKSEHKRLKDEVGLVRGLAYTSAGGEVLDVEVAVVEGVGKLELTGNLGDVMKESARAAVSYVRSRAAQLGIDPEFYKNRDIHIHFPEGAVPKDGPSAGITVCTALASALSGLPVRRDIAMTGEISLRGRVLPIGGLREKTMAALRAGVKEVIIPQDNEADLDEIDQSVRAKLSFTPVERMEQVLDIALVREDALPANAALPARAARELCAVRQ